MIDDCFDIYGTVWVDLNGDGLPEFVRGMAGRNSGVERTGSACLALEGRWP